MLKKVSVIKMHHVKWHHMTNQTFKMTKKKLYFENCNEYNQNGTKK